MILKGFLNLTLHRFLSKTMSHI